VFAAHLINRATDRYYIPVGCLYKGLKTFFAVSGIAKKLILDIVMLPVHRTNGGDVQYFMENYSK
jgi:hypothetical protein